MGLDSQIEVMGLTKRFPLSREQRKEQGTAKRHIVAVDGLSFNVMQGEVFGLLGPNGAGKTTTLRLLSTLIAPDSGEAIIHGHSITADPKGVRSCIVLGLVVLSVTLLVVTIIVIVSTLATSTKEAQTWLTPIMMAVMGIGIVGIASKGVQTDLLFYALPLYNGVESMIGILSFRIDLASIVVCIASNVAFSLLGLLVLERLFKSERVMFAR